jgi:hypothetical protein
MLAEVADLLVLQERDQRLAKLQSDLARYPRELTALDERATAAKAAVEKSRDEVRRNEADRRKLELEAQAKQQIIARYKSQQLQTRKNDEYSALLHEIEREEAGIALLEDQELVLMEAQEKLQAQLRSAEENLKTSLAEIARDKAIVQGRLEQAQNAMGQAEAQRTEAEAKVDANVLRLYRRILASKKDPAVVEIHNGICGGCHMRLITQTVNRAERGDTVTQCDNCGRILYRE